MGGIVAAVLLVVIILGVTGIILFGFYIKVCGLDTLFLAPFTISICLCACVKQMYLIFPLFLSLTHMHTQ